jgi:diamine N-acetyltransferase
MYGLDPDDMTVNFIHFMIDGKEQGKGYGKAAMEQLLRRIRKDYPDQGIWLSLHPQNMVAIRLYKGFGFEFQVIGLETDEEVFMYLRSL